MAFVSGPRQVGKTTTCRSHAGSGVNWDDAADRELILGHPAGLAERLGLHRLGEGKAVVLFDELHKFPRWKSFLKGFFDRYEDRACIVVTGSSRMEAFRRGGDSLMGRYFPYRMHPFSVAETAATDLPDPERVVRPPRQPGEEDFEALLRHGGFPEPFLERDRRFTLRWQALRRQQLLREDVRDLSGIRQLDQLDTLARLLAARSAGQLVYSNLARDVQVSVDTVRRWVDALCSLHLGFRVRPWHRSVPRSLRKEPKWLLRDWSGIENPGARAETLVGCHLLKAVEGWTDLGLGSFELAYLRDKQQREVDFVVVRDGRPWFLAEVKLADERISPSLRYFQEKLAAPFAFQIVLDAPYAQADCFAQPGEPLAVPARTFLSQLL